MRRFPDRWFLKVHTIEGRFPIEIETHFYTTIKIAKLYVMISYLSKYLVWVSISIGNQPCIGRNNGFKKA